MFFIIAILTSDVSILNAQTITWQKIFGGPLTEVGRYGIQTYDGSYIILNSVSGSTNGGPYLLCLDQYGNQIWNKIIDTSSTCTCIQQTKDSGFIISGSKNNNGLLIKTDRSGNVIWKRYFSPNNYITLFTKVRVTETGNFIICGFASFFPTKAFVLKTDSLGNLMWQNFLIYGGNADAEDLTTDNKGNIYFTGGITVNNFIKTLFAKLNSEGEFIWFNYYGSEGNGDAQGGYSIVSESSRELFLAGVYKNSSSTKAHFTKIDSSGKVIFQNILPQTFSAEDMCRTLTGNYAIAGGGGSDSPDILFILLNNKGDILTRKLFNSNGDESDSPSSIVETSENGFLITGSTSFIPTNFGGNLNIYVIKTDSIGNATPVSIKNISSDIPLTFKLYQNYPNPFNPNTKIKFDLVESGVVKIEIFDNTGKKIITLLNERKNQGTYELRFEGANLSSGIYYYKMTSKNYSFTKKMLLLK